jgi:serine/threonine-protein kinase PknK
VRDVVAHLAATAVLSRAGFVGEFIRAGFRTERIVQRQVSAARRRDASESLTALLALMAEGRSNAGIGRRLWVTEGTVEKHVRSIMTRLNLHETGDDHRRVLAAITFLQA